jgi:predicted oxidoreductase
MYSTPWMSELVVGTMRWGVWGANFTTAQYEAIIEAALEEGLTTFDHADIYGGHTTEAEFGAALKLHPEWREQMELVTKCGIIQV